MASACAAEIVRFCPAGPLTLIGFSWTGLVALELARRLREAGRAVHLVLLESTPFAAIARSMASKSLVQQMRDEGTFAFLRERAAEFWRGGDAKICPAASRRHGACSPRVAGSGGTSRRRSGTEFGSMIRRLTGDPCC